jgi:hypothetical protein
MTKTFTGKDFNTRGKKCVITLAMQEQENQSSRNGVRVPKCLLSDVEVDGNEPCR